MESQSTSRWKNRLINLSITLGTCLILFVIYLIVFNNYKKNLADYKWLTRGTKEQKEIAPLTQYDEVQLGFVQSLNHLPNSSYLNLPTEKPNGTYRIGIFGCSYVRGVGAAQGYDFPSHLQKKYQDIGSDSIEVINFGVGTYGMNRAFYIWNRLAKLYELDVVIFNIHRFHYERDRTFIFRQDSYGPIHGRYILEDGKLKYIAALGDSHAAASAGYYSPIPAWQYWRYEAKTPAPFRAFLPKGRELKKNPFYYHPDPESEWKALYAAIFDSVAKATPRLILAVGDKQTLGFVEHLTAKNIEVLHMKAHELKREYKSIYEAFDRHPNGLGYQLIAEELYAYLLDSTNIQLPVLSYGKQRLMSTAFHENWGNLIEVQKLYLGINGEELAVFTNSSLTLRNRGKRDKIIISDFDELGVKSLICVHTGNDYRFIPFGESLTQKLNMTLQFDEDGQEKVHHLTEVVPVTPFWGLTDSLNLVFKVDEKRIRLNLGRRKPLIVFSQQKNISKLTIKLGQTTIMEGKLESTKGGSQWFTLTPTIAPIINLRGSLDQKMDVNKIPSSGMIDLIIKYKNGKMKDIPFTSYQVDTLRVE